MPRDGGPLAFGGGPLCGSNIVRVAYLDEAGISNAAEEPYCVVGGVLVNADQQWKAVEQRLAEIADEYTPQRTKGTFAFHAKDIWHGSKLFDRNSVDWPRDKRMQLLRDLCAVPAKFGLPVVIGFTVREKLAKEMPGLSRKDLAINAQVYAALRCTIQIEMYMQRAAADGEVAMLIYEDNQTCRTLIRKTHNFLRIVDISPVLSDEIKPFFPMRRVVDTAHFADKTDTSLIQLADVCAFVMKGRLIKPQENDELFEPLFSQMAVRNLLTEAWG